MTWEQVWSVLRWVLAALAAGFIGQFGRSLALHLIEQRRTRRATHDGENRKAAPASAEILPADPAEALAKLEKKRAKAEIKRLKKSAKNDD